MLLLQEVRTYVKIMFLLLSGPTKETTEAMLKNQTNLGGKKG